MTRILIAFLDNRVCDVELRLYPNVETGSWVFIRRIHRSGVDPYLNRVHEAIDNFKETRDTLVVLGILLRSGDGQPFRFTVMT
jgi:hypothetical protein